MVNNKGALCAAPTCKNYRKENPGMSFFRFPNEKNRCLTWILNCRRIDLEATYLTVNCTYFFRNYVLCSRHFSSCCFMNMRQNKLVHDAVPTLFRITTELKHAQLPPLTQLMHLSSTVTHCFERSRELDTQMNAKRQEMLINRLDTIDFTIPHQHNGQAADMTSKLPTAPVPSSSGTPEATSVPIDSSPLNKEYCVCCARACLSTSLSATLYAFPADHTESRAWLERCGRGELLPLLARLGTVPTNFLLCKRHFTVDQFMAADGDALVPHAIPTIFVYANQTPSDNLTVKNGNQSYNTTFTTPPTEVEATNSASSLKQQGFIKSISNVKRKMKIENISTSALSSQINSATRNKKKLPMVVVHRTTISSSEQQSVNNDKFPYDKRSGLQHNPITARTMPTIILRKCTNSTKPEAPTIDIKPALIDTTEKCETQLRIPHSCVQRNAVTPSASSSCHRPAHSVFVEDSPITYADPFMTSKKKLDIVNSEISHLEKSLTVLNRHLSTKRNQKYILKRDIQARLAIEPSALTADDALRHIKNLLNESTYNFFICQRLHRKFPPWNLPSLEIPTIANRCGLGVRETLYKIFRMPTLRTMCRYRKMIKKDPSSVSDDHLLKNDLDKKFHRKLFRRQRNRGGCIIAGPKSISSMLNDYITKVNVNSSDINPADYLSEVSDNPCNSNYITNTIEISTENNINPSNLSYSNIVNGGDNAFIEQPLLSGVPTAMEARCSDSSYHHKKYNTPQKWAEFDQTD